MSLDVRYLELISKGPFESKRDERQAMFASKIMYLRQKGNIFLSALMITQALVQAITSVMLASMFGESIGFAISFTVLLIGAEILPQTLGNRFGITS